MPRNNDPHTLPKAYKNYNCKNCHNPSCEALFNFQNINSFKCNYCALHLRQFNYCDLDIIIQKNQELLLSIIYAKINSEKIPLKMIVFSNKFIENVVCTLVLNFIIDIIEENHNDDFSIGTLGYETKKLFDNFSLGIFKLSDIIKLLKNETFFELGEISSSHWAKRVYDSENITTLENG
jgi:hypothetical protein